MNPKMYRMAMIRAAVTFFDPDKLGFAFIISLAFNALNIAIGSRMIPKKTTPIIAYFKALLASSQGSVVSFLEIFGLHELQYF